VPQWSEILEGIGWPTNVLVVDFETYFDKEYCLPVLSNIEYIKSPKFEFLGLGCKWLSGQDSFFITGPNVKNYITTLQGLRGKQLEQVTLVMANSKFDSSILKHHCRIIPPYIIDIQDLARTQDARERTAVEYLAKLHKVGKKGPQLKALSGKHLYDLTGEEIDGLTTYTKNDAKLEGDLFKILLPRVSRPEVEIPFARHTLKMYLEPRITIDVPRAITLADKMEQIKTECIEATGYTQKEISGNISFKELLLATLPDGEKPPMKMGKKGPLLAIAKADPQRDRLLYHLNDDVRLLMEARVAVKSWPLHIKRIHRIIAQAKANSKLLGVPLKYHGAHTGRHSGEEAINLQNPPARGESIATEIKSLLLPMIGGLFVIADLSQIEARMLAELAGQTDLVEAFRNGEDIYSDFSSDLFHCMVRKPTSTDPTPIHKRLFILRYIGKQGILGLGFGMGDNRFYTQIQKEKEGREVVKSGKFTRVIAKKAVKQYRKKYSKITQFWYSVENAFKFVVKYPGNTNTLEYPGLIFESFGSTVFITLPSGRRLRYPRCRIDHNNDLKWKYGPIWGGAIVENIVQAASRDVLAEQILEIEAAGYDMVLPVHDSTVTWCWKKRAEKCKEDVKQIMLTPPKWRPNLPLDVDIEIAEKYK